ncbi:hypothetical protein WJX72_001418 [[Myrmecia] bisecta]|uniref:Uncharacterized protein n=1 Tax=[Myrmecia] bisecta TaxID=41462 RepID=A0AAW1PRP9_9CHLO
MSLRAYYGSLAGQPFATPPRIRYPADRVSARRSRSLSPRASVSIPRSKKGDYRSPEKSQGRWRTYSISHLHIAAGPPPSLQAQEEAQLPECTFAPEVHAVPNDEVLDVFELMPSRSPVPSRPTRPQPFQSTLDAVQAKHAQHAVGLYVDVVLPTGRKGRIGVKEGSNPQQLARSFAQAFQLTPKAAIALEDHIRPIGTKAVPFTNRIGPGSPLAEWFGGVCYPLQGPGCITIASMSWPNADLKAQRVHPK